MKKNTKRYLAISFFVFALALVFVPGQILAGSEERVQVLFEFEVGNVEEMLDVIDGVEALGGEVIHRFQNRVAWGDLPVESYDDVLALEKVSNLYKGEVNPYDFSNLTEDERLGILAWNESLKQDEADVSIAKDIINDDLEPAPAFEGQVSAEVLAEVELEMANSVKADGAPLGIGFYDTSEFMIGDISVGIILPQSNGAIDSSTETWTAGEEAQVVSEIQNAMNWWAAREPLANLSFTYHVYYGRTDSRIQTSYEPISRSADPYGTSGEDLWVNQIMTQLGYTDSARLDKVRHFNNDMRNSDGTDWAVTYFVVDSASDPDGTFADGYFAYMWVGGPYSVMTYDNDGYGIGNMDAVAAHELGHGFYANDQYSSACTCDQHRGYLNYYNSNCANSCSSNVASIMRGQVSPYTSGAVDYYARGQVGIIDANNNNILDVLEAKPSLSLGTSSGSVSSSAKKITGSTNVNKVSNSNPSGSGNDITINVINGVQYRLNGGSWVSVSAKDGSYGGTTEEFEFTISLTTGKNTLEVRSYDSSANWSDISSIELTRGDALIMTLAGFSGGPQLRQFNAEDGAFNGQSFFAFPEFLRSGARLATADIDADGFDEIIAGSGMTARPHVVAYEKSGFKRGIDFRPFPMDFTGGVDVAGGDIDGDGKDEVIVSQFTNGNTVKVYRYNDQKTIISEFTPFDNVMSGVTVTAGDIDWDGKDEVIVGASVGGGPHIRVYDIKPGEALLKPVSFFAFHPNSRSGVDVAAGDVDGDGKDEIAVSQLFYEEAWTKVYRYNGAQTILGEWRAFPAGVRSGANVEMFDVDSDGQAEVLVGPNIGGGPQVRGFESNGTFNGLSFFAYATNFRGGVIPVGGFF